MRLSVGYTDRGSDFHKRLCQCAAVLRIVQIDLPQQGSDSCLLFRTVDLTEVVHHSGGHPQHVAVYCWRR